jgi:DNA-binding GntR family transcriptional regulator
MTNLKIIKASPSLKESAFQALKNAVIQEDLKTARIYKIEELAKSLGISKTPVREALLDLSSRGFVTILPRKGVQINFLDEKDIKDLYQFRMAIEKTVIRGITPIITDGDIEKAQAINDTMADLVGTEKRVEYLQQDRQFHLFLAELSTNEYMIMALENVRDLVDWMGVKALLRDKRMKEVYDEHNNVIQMLKKRDIDGAEKMIEEHIRITMKKVIGNNF